MKNNRVALGTTQTVYLFVALVFLTATNALAGNAARTVTPVFATQNALHTSIASGGAAQRAAVSSVADGNSHGGGGFATQDGSVNVAMITQAVEEARLPVQAWFNSLKGDFQAYLMMGSDPLEPQYYPARLVPRANFDPLVTMQRFFEPWNKKSQKASTRDIFSALDKLQIDIRQKSSCMSQLPETVDGAFDPAKPDHICISAFRLAKKLTVADYQAQVRALIVHEVTHLMGGNEIEAVTLQSRALSDFMTVSFAPMGEGFKTYKSVVIPKFKDLATWMATSTSASETDHLAEAFAMQMQALWSSLQTSAYMLTVVRNELFDQLNQYTIVAGALANYACSLDPERPDAKRAECKSAYENPFDNQDHLAVFQYLAGDPMAQDDEFSTDLEIYRVKNHDDWQTQVNNFLPLLDKIADAVDLAAQQVFISNEIP